MATLNRWKSRRSLNRLTTQHPGGARCVAVLRAALKAWYQRRTRRVSTVPCPRLFVSWAYPALPIPRRTNGPSAQACLDGSSWAAHTNCIRGGCSTTSRS